MAWLEVIQLRTHVGYKHLLESELDKLHDEVKANGEKQTVMVYRGLIETDYCIHIMNDSDEVETPGSSLGVRLVAALKEFCCVHYQAWVGMKGK